jgi:hypothetical protein
MAFRWCLLAALCCAAASGALGAGSVGPSVISASGSWAAPCTLTFHPATSSLGDVQRALRTHLAAVREGRASGDGDIVVCLGAGRFDVSANPLELTEKDSHPKGGRVRWVGAADGVTAVSGGTQVWGVGPSRSTLNSGMSGKGGEDQQGARVPPHA